MRVNCLECEVEYEKESEVDSIICPLCRMQSKVVAFEFVSATFLVFGVICIGMFIPLAIVPLVIGENSLGLGYYLPLGRRGSMVTPLTLLVINLVNFGLMIAFLSVWRYFKRKFDKTKISLSEIEKDTPYFGRRWKE